MICMVRPGRNDPCHCGLNKKYKRCCMSLDDSRASRIGLVRSAQSLRDRNLALLAATADIFNLNRPWEKVKSGMSEARIREFYRFIAGLWPIDTDYLSLLPSPDSSLRALYLGENDPEMMLQNVFRFSLYTDQIILVNPFDNPNLVAEEFNPVLKPEEWRVQTLRLVYHLRILMPWIAAGLVVLVPDPGDFDRALRMKTFDMAEKRLGDGGLTDEDVESSSAHRKTSDLFYLSPASYIADKAREAIPGITNEEVKSLLAYVEKRREEDPLLPNDTLDKMPGQMTAMRMGANLEMGLFLCQTIGAFPYTNVKFRWREILSAGSELGPSGQVWSPLTNAFSHLNFKFLENVDSQFAVTLRQEGRLEGFRAYMRKLWGSVGGELDLSKAEMLARDFRDELAGEYAKAQAEWSAIDRDLMKWAVPAIGGAIAAAGGLATGLYSLAIPGAGFAAKGVNELIQAHMKRKEFRKKTPLSVFIDLDERQ
jgi:hypothetical protein